MTETQTSIPETELPDNVYTAVTLINSPGFDEISAKVLLERFLNTELEVHSFENSLQMPADEIDELEINGIFVIDLGQNQYKKRNCCSATEVVAKEFNITLTEAETELVEIADKDNETGNLNKWVDAVSIPWTLRKMYELEVYGASQRDVVSRMSHVVHTWLRYKERERDGLRDTAGMSTEFPDLMEKFNRARPDGGLQYNHFTALRYMRDMWHLGIPAEEIRERVNYWIQAWGKVKTAIAEGEKQFASLTPVKFTIGPLNGIVLESGDAFLNRAALCKCDILIAVNPKTGHALVATHELNINGLVRNLSRREPELWFGVRGWAVNGGLRNRGVKPTGFMKEELLALVREFPPQK